MKNAAQGAAEGVAEDVPQDVAQDLAFGARAARAFLATPPPPRRLCAARAEMGAQLGSSVAFGSDCGQALLGVPRKEPLCSSLHNPDTPDFSPTGKSAIAALWRHAVLSAGFPAGCSPIPGFLLRRL